MLPFYFFFSLAYSTIGNSASMDFGLLGASTSSSMELPALTAPPMEPGVLDRAASVLEATSSFDRNNLLRKSLDTSMFYGSANGNKTSAGAPELSVFDTTALDFTATLNGTGIQGLKKPWFKKQKKT